MFKFIKKRSIPPCRACANCISVNWKNLFDGAEEELRCKIKSNSYGDYCLCRDARGSRECRYEEGMPTKILRDEDC